MFCLYIKSMTIDEVKELYPMESKEIEFEIRKV